MLQDLPIECLQQIIRHLDSASAIINVSLVNRILYAKISVNNYGVFQYFVEKSFPSIRTSSSWRDAAISLTSRSRALDRRALIARECYPPDLGRLAPHQGKQKLGYSPVIDSYESARDQKEVLAWAAGGRIIIRSTTRHNVVWQTLRFPYDHQPINDILDLHLLRPRQRDNGDDECVIFRRATGQVAKVHVHGTDGYYGATAFENGERFLCCTDVSPAKQPLLAVCSPDAINMYQVHGESTDAEPTETFALQQEPNTLPRQRCSKFLSESTIAVSSQFFKGRKPAPIHVYDINSTRKRGSLLDATVSFQLTDPSKQERHCAITIAPLDNICGNFGQLFLSGWSDGIVRLHDTRTGRNSERSYIDRVDDGHILSIQPVGHETFLAAGHQNACLKIFDMRMPGARAYSYLNARKNNGVSRDDVQKTQGAGAQFCRRDINIFLAMKTKFSHGWKPLPLTDDPTLVRYARSVSSLSAPSPWSPRVYAGIVDHVIQLDFVSSDDLRHGVAANVAPSGGQRVPEKVFNLSCYEQPREGHESTDPVLLRKQVGFNDLVGSGEDRSVGLREEGWDERWRLGISDRTGKANWRH